MVRYTRLLFFFVLITEAVLAQVAVAQTGIPASQSIERPQVLLVMLHLSTNKIEGLKRRGMDKDIPMVIEGDEEVNQSIMKDFAKNFTFCPVYFFYDTCFEKAIGKKWDEITFYDYESLTMNKKVGTNTFPHYYFAEIGYVTPSANLEVNENITDRMVDRFQGDEDAALGRNYGINLYDADFKPLRGKLGFTDISLRGKGPLFGPKKLEFEGAAKFDRKLRARFNPKVKQ